MSELKDNPKAKSEELDIDELELFIKRNAQGELFPLSAQLATIDKFEISFSQVEEVALSLGLMPSRYQRNRSTITTEDQLHFFKSKVAIVGCGGLGGYVIEELARLGVGNLTVIDPDVFEEHNLNRQLLATHMSLGKPKVESAVDRVRQINPAVTVIPLASAFTAMNGPDMLRGVDVVVDALDSISTRLELSDACSELGIPLVHGTIAGWYGQVTTQLPGDNTLHVMYDRCNDDKGIERILGNLAFTPAITASFEVAEVCKVLLNRGTPLSRRILHIDLYDMNIEEIKL